MGRPEQQSVVNPTYLEFFGLTQPPFARLGDAHPLFDSEQYSLLMEHLGNAATTSDSLVVVCGADGSGKSTLLDRFVKRVEDNIACVIIDEDCHGELQFYDRFLTQIGFEEISGSIHELRNITKEFLVCRGIARDHVLVIIDNAHLTDPTILEQLRWLCEIKIKDRRALSVVLAGNANIVRVIDAPAMRQTKFRNHVVFSIRSFSEEETADYVWHRLGLAGGIAGVKLPNETNALIHRYSGGIPHLINKLCDSVLAEAHGLESRVITENIVRSAANKQQLLPHVTPFHGKGRRRDDPDFSHIRAVPGTAGDDTESLLHQVAELSGQLDGLRADKARAVEDIEARNKDIIALREELGSQTAEVQKLERFLSDSSDEITQQNLVLSENTAALQESEKRAMQLADDLEKEIQAREAVEQELAKATATAEELSQQKQALEATVDDVHIDLKAGLDVVDEHATNIESLEKTIAELNKELDGKAVEMDSLRDELNSRAEAFAELESRLEESRAEHESAQQQIATLKAPEELAEIEKATDELQAKLKEEADARETAEQELAKTTATVDELTQQKQQLQSTVDEVQADLEAGRKLADERAIAIEALEKTTARLKDEVESGAGELESLRDELALRNEILADLEQRFEQSQSACELAQSRLVELKSPKELEEIEQVSEKLVAELEKETEAREAAEQELAKATAIVEELSGQKQELQEKFDNVHTDLTAGLDAVDEHATNIESLEREIVDLKAELENRSVELDSLRDELRARDEAFAELEKHLQESKAERDSAQQQIATLKSPHELEEVEKAAGMLAAELEQQKHSTKAAEDELESLRERLASRDQAVADLESWLEESQKERDSAQQRIAALKDPEELEEIENVANRLATELEDEKRAREAVEVELTDARTAVEKLSQLERELQASVRDLNADLREAGERAVDAYVLERNVSDLEDKLEQKSRDLDARNEAFADLEKQLRASQRECELLRRGASPEDIAQDDAQEDAVTAPDPDTRVYSSHVVAKFVQSISNIQAYQTLRKYDPAFYDGLINTYKTLAGQDFTDKQIDSALRAEQSELMGRLIPRASDGAIISYAKVIIDQLDEFQLYGTEPCLTLLVPSPDPNAHTLPVYSDKTRERELDTLEKTLRTYDADRRLPAEEDVWSDLDPIFAELFDAFGADNVAAMENSYDPDVDRSLVCNVSRALYSGILKLPKGKAATALRWLLSSE